ncbi:low density lipoprotein receptor adapter protein 1 isoform X2 [Petromyzon marinus]|uniref:Low density lipoprotein receptor adapter protein 1 isoform X2 n=1 Tax=Petromyzon marinus TaxID=7757 RepID=A0AAJ7XFB4_PETMA|nr:low density lipoprotein receptor adapter protein 1 isoform X2 [Petromyzon marinus]
MHSRLITTTTTTAAAAAACNTTTTTRSTTATTTTTNVGAAATAAPRCAMEVFRVAGRAIVRSPNAGKSCGHKKLPENWTDTKETLLEGMSFHLKELGSTLVDAPKGEELTAHAVKRIVGMAKASGRKLRKVTVTVSPKGLVLHDSCTGEVLDNISIYRISYCTADKVHDKVFAFIAQSGLDDSLECFAFLCTKKKVAQAVTLTVAQAFRVAFEFWQAAKEAKEGGAPPQQGSGGVAMRSGTEGGAAPLGDGPPLEGAPPTGPPSLPLLDLSECSAAAPWGAPTHPGGPPTPPPDFPRAAHTVPPPPLGGAPRGWGATDFADDDDLDEAFGRLAHSRTNPEGGEAGVVSGGVALASPVPTLASPVPTLASPVPTLASPVPTLASPVSPTEAEFFRF